MGTGSISEIRQKIDHRCIQRRCRIGQPAHTERHGIVDLSVYGLFHSVKAGILLLNRVRQLIKAADKIDIGGTTAEDNVFCQCLQVA